MTESSMLSVVKWHFLFLCFGYGLFIILMVSRNGTLWMCKIKKHTIELHPKRKMLNTDHFNSDTCGEIINIDENVINKTNYLKIPKPKDDNNNITNCDDYFSGRNYINSSMTDDELYFPIAYSVLIYTDFHQFETLLEAIWRPQNLVCVHVDNKSPLIFHEAVKRLVSCFGNVFVASKSIAVYWGKFSVLEADLVCMRDLWRRQSKWRYFINLTGQEFPLKTNNELVNILIAYNGNNDIFGWSRRASIGRWAHLPPPPHNITPLKGPIHIVASRGYVDYILHSPVARHFLDWTKKTFVPDETFFATLNNNAHLDVPGQYKGRINQQDRRFFGRYKIWVNRPVHPCGGKYVKAVCVFGVRDLRYLMASKCLFANKFHYNYQPAAYKCLRSWYFRKVRQEMDGYLRINLTTYRQYAAGLNPEY